MDAEVGVVGVGTMGSMAMWQLARSGVSVIGFEQFGIGHDRSAAGGESRVFRTAYKEGVMYVPLLQEAFDQWRQLEEETGTRLLTINHGLMIGDQDSVAMKNTLESIKKYDLAHELLDAKEAKKRYPQHVLQSNEMMVVDKKAGYIRPHYAIISAVHRAEELGATVHQHTNVERIEPTANGVLIVANGKEYTVGKVIIATGPWLTEMLPEFNNQVEVRQVINTWFAAKDIEQFTVDKFPVLTRESKGVGYYGFPTLDGGTVKISLATTVDDRIASPNELNRHITLEELAKIRETVQSHLPDLLPNPVRLNTYMEAYSIDKHAVVGKAPSHEHVVVMGGFSGHGFKMAPALGKIASDLLMNNSTELSIAHLDPGRFVAIDKI